MRRFAEAFGARPETLMGLSGLGDIILTCSSPQSRNYSVGLALGAGRPIPNLLAEGIATANIARRLADDNGISMPVTAAVAAVLAGSLSVDDATDALMSRPLRAEAD
jgi:glycerol-3-phosphate dehydrogenase (NAD(P)+)